MTTWWCCPRSGHRLLWMRDAEGRTITRCSGAKCRYAALVPGISRRPADTETVTEEAK